MNDQWVLETNGAPLISINNLILDIWEQTELDYFLLPLKQDAAPYWEPRLINSPVELQAFNPFAPFMPANITFNIPGALRKNPGARIGVFLRPCEMRSLIEMSKRGSLDLSRLVTMTADCLGTFPADEYEWRVERKGSREILETETVKFSSQGSISSYRYRNACQACEFPLADNANINLGVIGLPIREKLLVISENETGYPIAWEEITHGKAPLDLVTQRNEIGKKVSYRRKASRQRIINEMLSNSFPPDIDALVQYFEGCGDCVACFGVCPICKIKQPKRTENNRYDKGDMLRWLISCVGCGMCEQECPEKKPISLIFANIREQRPEAAEYCPGSIVEMQLPI